MNRRGGYRSPGIDVRGGRRPTAPSGGREARSENPAESNRTKAPAADHLKLLTSWWRFSTEGAAQLLSEINTDYWVVGILGTQDLLSETNTDYRVVGILGTQGVGKSRLANLLCGLPLAPSASSLDPAASLAFEERPTRPSPASASPQPPFSTQQQEQVELFLADLFSTEHPSGLRHPAGVSSMSGEAVQHLQELQLATFLLATCHVVVVMVESIEDDMEVIQLMQAVSMCVHELPEVSAPSTAAVQGMQPAKVVFVQCERDLDGLARSSLFQSYEVLNELPTSSGVGRGKGSKSSLEGSDGDGEGAGPHFYALAHPGGHASVEEQQQQQQHPSEGMECLWSQILSGVLVKLGQLVSTFISFYQPFVNRWRGNSSTSAAI
eukprot:gene6679-3344_t